jgi:diguanylate cyclase (GGDEF)-like protein
MATRMPRPAPGPTLKTLIDPRLFGPLRPGLAPDSPEAAAEHEARLAEQQQAAATLYRHAPLGLAASAVLALATLLALDLGYPDQARWDWLALFAAVLSLRVIDTARQRRAVLPPPPRVLIRNVAVGSLGGAGAGALMPWLVLPGLEAGGAAIVLTGAIGLCLVGAQQLIALRRIALAHVALWLGSVSVALLMSGDGPQRMLGALTLVLLGLGVVATHRVHHLWWSAHARARDKQQLELRIDELADQLGRTRSMAEQAAAGLEQRIEDRTTALEVRTRELAQASVTDGLTGLPNRKGINQYLSEALPSGVAAQARKPLALLFLDLEHIKEVNDLMGHAAGDAVLRTSAERLRVCMPRGSFAARWGGDEFVVVLPALKDGGQQAQVVAEQIRAALSHPVALQERLVRVGCCIGIALAPLHGTSAEALLLAASHAVRAAKAKGSGRVRTYDASLAEQTGRQHELAQALPTAVEMGQLQVVYQPIVSSVDDQPSHVEALVRWRHPQWGAVSPGEFIPVAESSGLILPMGRLVLRQACHDAARWGGANPPKVSVNVSAIQVSSGQLVAQVREALATSGLPARRLVIELTESLPMSGRERVDATLSELHAMGVTLAIDDFGTGYSSLSALMRQPLTLLKVDKSFVQDVPGQGEVLINATVDVARRFGLKVVAEGVETRAQQARLLTLGVHYMQGYLFGRPMPNNEFAVWLALRDGSERTIALRETIAG